MLIKPNTKITILNTVDKLRYFFEHTAVYTDSPYVVVDTETDSTLEKTAKLFGIGICFNEQAAYYIPIRDNTGNLLWKDKTIAKMTFELFHLLSRKKLLGHNIIYDVLVLKNNLGVDFTPNIFADTILLKHCVDEEPPFGLKETAVKYLGPWADKAQKDLFDNIKANGGKTTQSQMEMWKADTTILGEYCCWDVVLTYLLFKKFSLQLTEQGLERLFFEEEVMPLYKECVIPMKDKGFPIDVEYFNQLKQDIKLDILKLQNEIQKSIKKHTDSFINNYLNEEFPVKKTGNFPKELAVILGMPFDVSVTKASIKKFNPETEDQKLFKYWFLDDADSYANMLTEEVLRQVQLQLWYKKNPSESHIFNLNSNKHLAWLFFEELGMEAKEKTDSGAPKLDASTLESMAGEHPFCDKIIEYKKLQKILGTYVEGILDRQYQGVVYGSFLMFGTTSGRFSSRDPNMQNLPRVKDEESNLSPLVLKYVNAIKKGFVAGKGYKIVNADFSQLEPCAFAAACGDLKLQQIFKNKWDLYSSIAIEAEGLSGEYSADKKAPNYLKNHRPELRQKYKAVALAVVYGAEAGRISQVLDCSFEEAQEIIDNYLDAYPGLVQYMKDCDKQVATQGFIRNKFGRVRHLPEAKRLAQTYGKRLLDKKWARENDLSEVRWHLKNYLNNGKNFPIQSTAAHIVNRAMLSATRKFKEHNIDAQIVAQVHDEITVIAKEEQANQASNLLKEAMENTTKIEVPLSAEPLIANNWAEAK
jgi:DNA polymerase I-like protein with 3'-5' exonuclease and polymerase domains